jgi:hypothetical protein
VTNSPSAGDVAESSPNTSQSRTRSSARDAKQSTSISKKLEDLLNNPNRFNAVECFVGQVLLQLDPKSAELFKQALGDKRVRHMDLLRLCNDEGYKMSEATMRRHRSGGCRCPK